MRQDEPIKYHELPNRSKQLRLKTYLFPSVYAQPPADTSTNNDRNYYHQSPGTSDDDASHHQLSPVKEAALRALYESLDIDRNGVLDIHDLTYAFQQQYNHIPSEYASKFMDNVDTSKNNRIEFSELVAYVLEHERRLAVVFNKVDSNKDGRIDIQEMKVYLHDLNVKVSDAEIERLMKHINQNNDNSIDLAKFQEYLLFCPSYDDSAIGSVWVSHMAYLDFGEDIGLPNDFTAAERAAGLAGRHLIAGGIAGAVSRTCTAPLDRLKTFMQVHANSSNNMGMRAALRIMYKEGGLLSFWRGNGINVFKIAPETAIKFTTYEEVKVWMRGDNAEITTLQRFAAGSTAGAFSQSVIYPFEVLKTRLALRRTGQLNRGVINASWVLYQKEGLHTFFRGYVPNIMGIIPYAGIDLCVYETLKKQYTHVYGTETGVVAQLACGMTSGTCGMLVSYPLALVRTRLQALAWLPNVGEQPSNMSGQFRYIVKADGWRGLYRGITPNFAKVLPAVSISYVVYEKVRTWLGITMT